MGYKEWLKAAEKQKKADQVSEQLKGQIKALERSRDQYAEEAKKYLKAGKKEMFAAQVALMKYAIYNISILESMEANYSFAKEMSKMQNISKNFTRSIKGVLKDVVKVADSINVANTEKLFQKALEKSTKVSFELKDCLKNNSLHFTDSINSASDVSDDEIMKILGADIQQEEEQMDDDLSLLEKEFVKPAEEKQPIFAGPTPSNDVPPAPAPREEPKPVQPEPEPEPEPAPAPAPAPVVPEEPKEPAADDDNIFNYHGKDYVFPPLSLLESITGQEEVRANNTAEIQSTSDAIVNKLHNFGIDIELDGYIVGAACSRLEYRLLSNTSLAAIARHADDISMVIRRKVRLLLPIEGKDLIGVEVQNSQREILSLKEMLEENSNTSKKINGAIGYTIEREPVFMALDSLPHLLVGGATKSGKSVFLNSLITSLLFRYHPKDLRLVLIDFKRVELNVYNYIPHLVGGRSIDEFEDALDFLYKLCDEMERRYAVLNENKCRNVNEYNEKVSDDKKIPTILTIIDEYADFVTNKGYKEAGVLVQRLAQKARAANINLIIATQQPTVKVIDGVIKANLPSRVAFKVASHTDSMTILDQTGAQDLLGAGDMLFQNGGATIRLQSPYISTDDTNTIIDFIVKENS